MNANVNIYYVIIESDARGEDDLGRREAEVVHPEAGVVHQKADVVLCIVVHKCTI